MSENNQTKSHFSTTEAAKIMHISRIALFKKIKTGQLKAQKVGRNYVIDRTNLEAVTGTTVSSEQKEEIKNIVKKAVKEYGETFRRLGKEE